jgi:hypothetical protein
MDVSIAAELAQADDMSIRAAASLHCFQKAENSLIPIVYGSVPYIARPSWLLWQGRQAVVTLVTHLIQQSARIANELPQLCYRTVADRSGDPAGRSGCGSG